MLAFLGERAQVSLMFFFVTLIIVKTLLLESNCCSLELKQTGMLETEKGLKQQCKSGVYDGEQWDDIDSWQLGQHLQN